MGGPGYEYDVPTRPYFPKLGSQLRAKARFQPDLNSIKTTPTTVLRFENHKCCGSFLYLSFLCLIGSHRSGYAGEEVP